MDGRSIKSVLQFSLYFESIQNMYIPEYEIWHICLQTVKSYCPYPHPYLNLILSLSGYWLNLSCPYPDLILSLSRPYPVLIQALSFSFIFQIQAIYIVILELINNFKLSLSAILSGGIHFTKCNVYEQFF